MVKVYVKFDIIGEKVKVDLIVPVYSNKPGYICTWITKNPTKKGRIDYLKQMKRNDGFILWDDAKDPVADKGGYLVFIDGNTFKMYIYKILKIYTKEERLPEWSNNGYTNEVYDTSSRRAFLASSKCLKVVDWWEYREDVGYAAKWFQCTLDIRYSDLLKI
jgi:hypothetical protein